MCLTRSKTQGRPRLLSFRLGDRTYTVPLAHGVKQRSQMRRSHSMQSIYVEKSQDRKRSVSDIVSWTVNSACTALPSTDGTRRMWEHNSRFPRLPARTAPPTTSLGGRPRGPRYQLLLACQFRRLAGNWRHQSSAAHCGPRFAVRGSHHFSSPKASCGDNCYTYATLPWSPGTGIALHFTGDWLKLVRCILEMQLLLYQYTNLAM